MPLKILYFGHHNGGAWCLRQLVGAGHDVALVITNAPYKGETVWYESVAATAAALNLRCAEIEAMDGEALAAEAAALAPDVVLSVGFRRLIPPTVLQAARLGGLNLHDSLLPRYRGFTPSTWAIINGETETGVTLHQMAEEADTGAILGQRRVAIAPDDTGYTLGLKLARTSADLVAVTLPLVESGQVQPIPQDDTQASWYGRRGVRPEDDRIDWRWPAGRIADLVRAVTEPLLGAWARIRGATVRVWAGQAVPAGPEGWEHQLPGTVVGMDDGGVVVRCSDGLFRIRRATRDGDAPDAPWPESAPVIGDQFDLEPVSGEVSDETGHR